MSCVVALQVPASLIRERGVVLANDFMHAHRAICFGLDGRGYVLSEIFYNYSRYGQSAGANLHTLVVSVLDADSNVEQVATLDALTHAMRHHVEANKERLTEHLEFRGLTLSPQHELVFTATRDRVHVLSSDLTQTLAIHDALGGAPLGLTGIVMLPDGGFWWMRHNGDFGYCPTWQTASLAATAVPLGVLVGAAFTKWRHGCIAELVNFCQSPYVGNLAALSAERLLVSFFARTARSGMMTHHHFKHVIVNGKGDVVATLPLGEADSPYNPKKDSHLRSVAHPMLGAWLNRTDAAFHLWNPDGALLARIPIEGALRALAPLQVFGVAPSGAVVFLHPTHHTLAFTDPVVSTGQFELALADLAARYKSDYARIKKTTH
jgi:hypothetical protein